MMTGPENMQSLSCSFKVPSRHTTTVRVIVEPNKHPAKAGSSLLFPKLSISTFEGFPVCNAKIEATEDRGYAAIYGWIQFVREAPLSSPSTMMPSDLWEIDPLPITAHTDSPFIWFGPEPQLFDGPFRVNRTDMDWTCWSFLTYINDSVMTKSVRPIVVFEWGYRIDSGNVTIKTLKFIDVHKAWEQQRELLQQKFGSWSFESIDDDLTVNQVPGGT